MYNMRFVYFCCTMIVNIKKISVCTNTALGVSVGITCIIGYVESFHLYLVVS